MLTVIKEFDLEDFEGWSGAERVLDRLIEFDVVDEAEEILKSLYEDEPLTETKINDWLRFNEDEIYSQLGLTTTTEIEQMIEDLEDRISDLEDDEEDHTEELRSLEEELEDLQDEYDRFFY